MMKKIIFALSFFLCFIFVYSMEFVPKQMIVKTKTQPNVRGTKFGYSEFDSFLEKNKAKKVKRILSKNSNRYFLIEFEDELSWKSIQNAFPNIEYIQPNYLNDFYEIPNDELIEEQMANLENIKATAAWNYSTGDNDIIVAIIDSGIEFNHPDLSDNIYINQNEIPNNDIDDDNNGFVDDYQGWDFVDAPELGSIAADGVDYIEEDNLPEDKLMHGTHVSGIIGAVTDNSEGIAGISWNLRLLPVRAGFQVSGAGGGYLQDDDAAAAIIYAADMGANVINLSWGDSNYSPIIKDACEYAFDLGAVIVASSGNTPIMSVNYPAKLSTTIAVGAVDEYKNLASFSSYGPNLDLVAPGVGIISTFNATGDTMYVEKSGTSMAAPFVAGAVSLLLSHQINLDFNEVRGKLISSSQDLGTDGFDNYYGHGLLNVSALLNNYYEPVFSIVAPESYEAFASEFDIRGVVNSPDFSRFSLMFCNIDEENQDWEPVWYNVEDPYSSVPIFYYEQSFEEEYLGHFHFPPNMEDGEKILRLRLINSDGQQFDATKTVKIDQTTPQFLGDQISLIKRYEDEIPFYYLNVASDDPVDVYSELTVSGINYNLSENSLDKIHFLKLPDYINDGSASADVTIQNEAGLDNHMFVEELGDVNKDYINTSDYRYAQLGLPLYLARGYADFDGNGKNEFLGMNLDSLGITAPSLYEINSNLLQLKYEMPHALIPLAVGNTNDEGNEILGLNQSGNAVIYESFDSYPEIGLQEFDNAKGGILIDYDEDGVDELILVQSLADGQAVVVYQRENMEFAPINHLYNESDSYINNFLSPRVTGGKLDDDEYPDIVASDMDGQVLVYELYQHEDEDESILADSLVWTCRLPAYNLYYLDSGDFNGDGEKDFIVGGYNEDYSDPDMTFWHFEVFTAVGDNDYSSMGYIGFNEVNSNNSINVADLDNDGDEEIVMALNPSMYILDYTDNGLVPIFHGQTKDTYQALPFLQSSNADDTGIIINHESNDGLKSYLVAADVDFSGPNTPANFELEPLGKETALLSWNASRGSFFKIYSKDEEGVVTVIDSTYSNNYIAEELTENEEYLFAVSKVDDGYIPEESYLTNFKRVIPNQVPGFTGLEMITANSLLLSFDNPLHQNALKVGNYVLEPWEDLPSSVNFTNNKLSVLLTFRDDFVKEIEEYTLSYFDLEGHTGVNLPDSSLIFSYKEDLTRPFITEVNIINQNTFDVIFSENLEQSGASNINNYSLLCPKIAPHNSIQEIEFNSFNKTRVFLQKKLKNTTEDYVISTHNIRDLNGNLIANNNNKFAFNLTEIRNLEYVEAIPNPLYINRFPGKGVEFFNLPEDKNADLRIYTLSGDLVYNGKINSELNIWNLENKHGENVAPGIYFYLIKCDNDFKKGKIGILK